MLAELMNSFPNLLLLGSDALSPSFLYFFSGSVGLYGE